MGQTGNDFEKFRDKIVRDYFKTPHINLTDFEIWLLKEQFKTIEELKEIYNLLPDGEFKGEAADWIVRAKLRIFK